MTLDMGIADNGLEARDISYFTVAVDDLRR